ncbi:DUF3500 domain-containing protein [Fulvimonas yonginensis]|uniref:DUF3500 domain-containing protein n=1 Tax=Fulvimonas yonginensis TaxID=1495200 RepID=A0ABU8JEQ3_9GAMM
MNSVLLVSVLSMATANPSFAATPSAAAAEMETAADQLMASLSPAQRQQALVALADPDREGWRYLPDWALKREGQPPRRGARIGDLTPVQKVALHHLLQVSLSDRGYLKADGIINMDDLLRELMVRAVEQHAPEASGLTLDEARQFGSGNYWFSLFRDPRSNSAWGWRLEGHHLSINFTIADGLVFGTPEFMGVEPAMIASGPNAGFRLLAAERSLGRTLIRSLTPGQCKLAYLSVKTPQDIIAGPRGEGRLKRFLGIPASGLSSTQRRMLRQLIEQYAENLRADVAGRELDDMDRAGFDKIHFAFAGSADDGQPLYYVIHGPTLSIEFDNTDADPDHIHTVWHGSHDFGGDVLRQHYRQFPHPHL